MSTITDTREPKHILVLGDAGVGKTEYIKKLLNKGKFEPRYIPTGKFTITSGYDTFKGGPIVCYEWPGQVKHGDITFPEKVDEIVFMYDCTSKLSYWNVKDWQKKVKEHYGEDEPESKVLGTKFDMAKRVEVSTRHMFWSKPIS